jgi:hypothetical protein
LNGIGAKWESLAYLSGRLEALAKKQLSGDAFDPNDRQFIRDYGTLKCLNGFGTGPGLG